MCQRSVKRRNTIGQSRLKFLTKKYIWFASCREKKKTKKCTQRKYYDVKRCTCFHIKGVLSRNIKAIKKKNNVGFLFLLVNGQTRRFKMNRSNLISGWEVTHEVTCFCVCVDCLTNCKQNWKRKKKRTTTNRQVRRKQERRKNERERDEARLGKKKCQKDKKSHQVPRLYS